MQCETGASVSKSNTTFGHHSIFVITCILVYVLQNIKFDIFLSNHPPMNSSTQFVSCVTSFSLPKSGNSWLFLIRIKYDYLPTVACGFVLVILLLHHQSQKSRCTCTTYHRRSSHIHPDTLAHLSLRREAFKTSTISSSNLQPPQLNMFDAECLQHLITVNLPEVLSLL